MIIPTLSGIHLRTANHAAAPTQWTFTGLSRITRTNSNQKTLTKMNNSEINQYPNMPDIERPPLKAKDLYSGMPFRRKGSNILYAVDGINTSRNILRVIAYVNTRLHRYEAWKLSDALTEFRRGVLFFAMDLEVAKAPARRWKPKFRLMRRYRRAKYYSRCGVAWMLEDENDDLVECQQCRSLASAVIVVGDYRIPVCRRHFLRLFPGTSRFPVFRELSDFQPTEAEPPSGFI